MPMIDEYMNYDIQARRPALHKGVAVSYNTLQINAVLFLRYA